MLDRLTVIRQTPTFSHLFQRETGLVGAIDAFRGWAILLVLFVHASQVAPVLDGWAAKIAAQGARGVQLFYVISALTLMISWHSRNDGAWPFYIRRLFRITPMFWLAIPVFLWIGGTGPSYWAPEGIHAWQIAATATFLHGFHPQSINSVVHGGATIAVEMMFYAIFPLLVRLTPSWTWALAWTLATFWAAKWLYPMALGWWPGENRGLAANYAFLWFPNQLPSFLVGMLLYFTLVAKMSLPRWIVWAMLLVGLAALFAIPFRVAPFRVAPYHAHLAYAPVFAVIIYAVINGAGSFLTVSPLQFLGRISYSAYLWHFALLATVIPHFQNWAYPLLLGGDGRGLGGFLVTFAGLVVITSILSVVTYLAVERPMIRLGSRLVTRFSA
jgi:exopolysaccharide production protein ExoZ